jgi:metal-responsive CopG/Arc/MetJ family transcriptional regulator
MASDKLIVNLVFDPALLERVEDYWHTERLSSRAVAIRELIQRGLDQQGPKAGKKKAVK